MEYVLNELNKFEEGIEFTEWLAQESFIRIMDVCCATCDSLMKQQGL